jgi:hypothetical protein
MDIDSPYEHVQHNFGLDLSAEERSYTHDLHTTSAQSIQNDFVALPFQGPQFYTQAARILLVAL